MSKNIEFLTEDVLKVARVLLSSSVQWSDGLPYSKNPNDGYRCIYCDAEGFQKEEDLKHNKDCAVLIASDILT